jgi:hypothetical protein
MEFHGIEWDNQTWLAAKNLIDVYHWENHLWVTFQQAMFDDTGGYFIWVKKKLYLWDAAQLMLHPEPGSGFLTQNVCTYDVHLLGGLEHEFHFSIQLVFSSSQLTFTPSFW